MDSGVSTEFLFIFVLKISADTTPMLAAAPHCTRLWTDKLVTYTTRWSTGRKQHESPQTWSQKM